MTPTTDINLGTTANDGNGDTLRAGGGVINDNFAVVQGDLTTHINDTSNPHSVTKTQVGLGSVDNTSDTDKPISTAAGVKNTSQDDAIALNTAKNTYPSADSSKLSGIEAGAEVNTLNDVVAGTNVTIDKTDPLNPIISSTGGGGGGAVDSVNGETGDVVLDTGDIAATTDKNYITDAAQTVIGNTSGTNTGDQDISGISTNASAITDIETKTDFISVTQSVDLDTMESDIASNNSKVGVTTQISNVVEDTTPQLGGDLDFNGNDITGTGGADVSISKTGAGGLTVSSAAGGLNLSTTSGNGDINISAHGAGTVTVAGRDIATDGTKIDGIEAGADVTDSTNVTAAGAVMDSELTSETDVKALNQSVVSGAAPVFATTNMTEGTDKNFVTDAEATVIGNTSGTNTGDQTSVTGNSGSTDALKSATTTVDVSASIAPTTGQVLTATSSTTATWQDAGGGGGGFPEMVYDSGDIGSTLDDTDYTITHNLGITETDVLNGRYSYRIIGQDTGGYGLVNRQAGHGFNGGCPDGNKWGTSAGNDSYSYWQANTMKARYKAGSAMSYTRVQIFKTY